MSTKLPAIVLNNGQNIPAIGLGTFDARAEAATEAVKAAIDVGYRHIDSAWVYENELEVGAGINEKLLDGTVGREDLFVTSKLWNSKHRQGSVESALQNTLRNLNLTYVDLYLMHTPMAITGFDDDGGPIYEDVDYVETWKALEHCVDAGLTKNIGLSNFNTLQLQRVWEVARIKPVVNQIECHPYFTQKSMVQYCAEKNIVVVGYSPLGAPNRPWAQPEEPILLQEPKVIEIADKYQKTPAQILIRYHIDNGIVPIPKSTNKDHIVENFQALNFKIAQEHLDALDKLNCNLKYLLFIGYENHAHYPFGDLKQEVTRN
jgi:aldehyde reductase